MKIITIALLFQFLLSCWPKVNIINSTLTRLSTFLAPHGSGREHDKARETKMHSFWYLAKYDKIEDQWLQRNVLIQ